MSEPFKTYSAIFPIIIRIDKGKEQILLHRRQNTGYQDGKWDIAGSGHVDKDETAQMAVVRECKEELGIDVDISSISFARLSHRLTRSERTYYDIYFVVSDFTGTPTIMEPFKCSELKWFYLDELPDDLIDCRKIDLDGYKNNNPYGEIIEDTR